jgi:peptidoglycan/LPS O-acetylase OafA/YrhL
MNYGSWGDRGPLTGQGTTDQLAPPGNDAALAKSELADRGDAPRPKTKLLWAEGLRGIAAAIVVNQHWVSGFATEMNNGYGPGPAENFDNFQDHGSVVWWLTWPGLRVLYNGTFTVYLFFVLSGFVLSHRYLSQIYSGILRKPGGLAHAERTLGSTMLRRFTRLFIPCLAIVLISYLILYLGGYDRASEVATYATGNPGGWFYRAAPNRETSSSFLRLFRQTWVSMWIDRNNDLDSSMWTMAYELTGSVYTFCAALVIGRLSGLRFPPETSAGGPHWAMLIAFCWCLSPSIYPSYSYYSCFFIGIAIAWLDIDASALPWRAWIRARHPVSTSLSPLRQGNAWIQEIFPTCMFILALWFASFPMRGSSIAWANPLRVVAQFFYSPEDPEELVKMWYPIGEPGEHHEIKEDSNGII